MPNLLETIRDDINVRLSELRPLVEEAAQLQRALDALGGTRDTSTANGQPSTGRARRGRRQRRSATVRGQTGQQIIEYVKANAGSTAGDVAKALGLNRQSTSTRLTQLAKAGEIRKATRGYSAAT